MAKKINAALDTYFPSQTFDSFNKYNEKFRIISELGTYYTCSAYTLCVHVMAKKEIKSERLEKISSDSKFLTGSVE